MAEITYNKGKLKYKLMIGTPTLGRIRFEWAAARYSQVVPVNYALSNVAVPVRATGDEIFPVNSPVGYSVHDAYNIITKAVVERGIEWFLCIEDDVVIPPDFLLKMWRYIEKGDIPIVSGLYFVKCEPPEPQVYRGRGNGTFKDFKLGEKVWCDGVAMGCLLVHSSILKYMYENSEPYRLYCGMEVRKVFDTPRETYFDPELGGWQFNIGTQDLPWCDRIIKEGILHKTGWKKIAKKQYPFLVDTGIFCKHIDLATGRQWPQWDFVQGAALVAKK